MGPEAHPKAEGVTEEGRAAATTATAIRAEPGTTEAVSSAAVRIEAATIAAAARAGDLAGADAATAANRAGEGRLGLFALATNIVGTSTFFLAIVDYMANPGNTFVYIASNSAQALFVGVARDLEATMSRHRSGSMRLPGLDTHGELVYVESHRSLSEALRRATELNQLSERDLRGFIRHANPDWREISTPALALAQ